MSVRNYAGSADLESASKALQMSFMDDPLICALSTREQWESHGQQAFAWQLWAFHNAYGTNDVAR